MSRFAEEWIRDNAEKIEAWLTDWLKRNGQRVRDFVYLHACIVVVMEEREKGEERGRRRYFVVENAGGYKNKEVQLSLNGEHLYYVHPNQYCYSVHIYLHSDGLS